MSGWSIRLISCTNHGRWRGGQPPRGADGIIEYPRAHLMGLPGRGWRLLLSRDALTRPPSREAWAHLARHYIKGLEPLGHGVTIILNLR